MVERKLCEMYNVSRSPIRQALSALSAEGILDVKAGKGIVVPEYSLEDILEVYDLWEVLQVYALQVSLHNYTEAHDLKLKEINDKTIASLENGNLEERMAYDSEFHDCIVHFAANHHLDMLFGLMENHKKRFDTTTYDDAAHGEKTCKQHDEILNALLDRDLERAIKGIHEHCDYIKKYYIDKLINKKHNINI